MQDPKQRRSKIGTVASNELIDMGDLIDLNHEQETTGEYSLALRELVTAPTSERLGSQQSPIPRGYEDRNLLGQHCEPSAGQSRRLISILENMDTPLQQETAIKGSGITPIPAGALRDLTQPLATSFPKLLGDPPLEVKRRGLGKFLGKFLNLGYASSLDIFSTLYTEEERSAIQLLQENQFDFGVKSFNKDSALCWAACSGHKVVVQLLLEKGADVAAKSKGEDGWTTLHMAAGGGHEAVAQLLLEKGANVAAKSKDGRTALHYAAESGHKAVARLLLEKGADVAAKSKDGWTAQDRAAQNRHNSVMWLLTPPLTPHCYINLLQPPHPPP